jgi:hypothetical protein
VGACAQPPGATTDNFDFTCDEKADCPNAAGGTGALCCFGFGNTDCLDNCGDTQGIQLCQTDAECANPGDKCTLQTCNAAEPGNPQQLYRVRMCGTNESCKP